MAKAQKTTKTVQVVERVTLTLTSDEASALKALTGRHVGQEPIFGIYNALADAGVKADGYKTTLGEGLHPTIETTKG